MFIIAPLEPETLNRKGITGETAFRSLRLGETPDKYKSICSSTLAGMRSCWESIKPDHSPITLLGKLFFRCQQPWEQRQHVVQLLWSVVVGVVVGGICVGAFLFQASHRW